MNIIFKGQELETKFTFNSFKFMKEFDVTELEKLETRPFMAVSIASQLLIGALNHNPKKVFSESTVMEILEEYVVEHPISELMEQLMEQLQESNFFKSLQKSQTEE